MFKKQIALWLTVCMLGVVVHVGARITTIASTIVPIRDDFPVDAGDTLIVDDGSLFSFREGADLIVRGLLLTYGDSEITFDSGDLEIKGNGIARITSTTVTLDSGDVEVRDNGHLYSSNATFKFGTGRVGVNDTSALHASNTTFTRNGASGYWSGISRGSEDAVISLDSTCIVKYVKVPDVSYPTPKVTALVSASPNPFNPLTTISYTTTPTATNVSVRVYNVTGQVVRTLVANKPVSAGTHSVVWNGRDNVGRHLSSGVYLIRLATPDKAITKRVTLVK
jgi:hypothetical protein